jgi:uncharacterized protein
MQPATPVLVIRVALLLLLAAMFITACSPLQNSASGPASVDRAERLLRQNNPAAAAQVYERLASDNAPPASIDFSFSAARAWLQASRADEAERVLAAVGESLTPAQRLDRSLLQVEVLLAKGQYAPAYRQAAALPEPRNSADASRVFQLQQQTALRASLPVEAVRAGLARERVAATEAERNTARRDLLTDLRQAIDRGLRVDPAAAREPLIRGWLEVGQIAASASRSPLGANAAIDRWRARFPGHPASTILASEILSAGGAEMTGGAASGSIALLLPLTGRQSVAAGLVRDGFQAGIDQLPADQRPEIRLYDTGTMNVSAALQSAQADGVAFLVGPLTREEVVSAAQLHSGAAPLLLLNSLGSQGGGRGVYQFALSPEEEARQTARQAFASGQRRALVIAPTGDWGTRVSAAFTEELTRAGGSVISQSTYDSARPDLTTVITRALAVDESRARFRRVQQVVGGTEMIFEARPRSDIDLIFAAGQQSLALRQIHPQLRFFGAGDVPTYMTSDGIDADPVANRDLEGVLFADMPWVLDESGPVAETRTTTQQIWGARGVRLSKLFAFGHDAAALAIALRSRATASPIAGLTGRLSITSDGRVERELTWARITEGALRPITPALR